MMFIIECKHIKSKVKLRQWFENINVSSFGVVFRMVAVLQLNQRALVAP